MWKIVNKSERDIKLTVSIAGHLNPGLILKPNQFCIAQPKLTAPMDKQIRSGFLYVDEEFDNSLFNFPLGVATDLSEFEKFELEAKKYTES